MTDHNFRARRGLQVALYAPPSVDPTRVVPISWRILAHETPSYTKTGSGQVV